MAERQTQEEFLVRKSYSVVEGGPDVEVTSGTSSGVSTEGPPGSFLAGFFLCFSGDWGKLDLDLYTSLVLSGRYSSSRGLTLDS